MFLLQGIEMGETSRREIEEERSDKGTRLRQSRRRKR